MDSIRGLGRAVDRFGAGLMRQVGAEESCAPLDGGGGVSALGESPAPTPPGSLRGDVPPRASAATVRVVPGGNTQLGKTVTSPWIQSSRSLVAVPTIHSQALFSSFLPFSASFSVSMLEELIRHQLRFLSLLANLLSPLPLGLPVVSY